METSEATDKFNVTICVKPERSQVQRGDVPHVSADGKILNADNITTTTVSNKTGRVMAEKTTCDAVQQSDVRKSPAAKDDNDKKLANTYSGTDGTPDVQVDTACSNIKNLAINDDNMNNERLNTTKADAQVSKNKGLKDVRGSLNRGDTATDKRMLGMLALLDYGDTSSDESIDNDLQRVVCDTNGTEKKTAFRPPKQENSSGSSSSSSSSASSPSNASQFSLNFYSSSSSSDTDDDVVGATSTDAVKSTAVVEAVPTPLPIVVNTTVTDNSGELTLDDLPPIQDLNLSVPEDECTPMGVVSSIVDRLVMIESLPNQPAFDIDTVLFMDKGQKTLGQVHDVIGQVTRPMYVVRFNTRQQIADKNVAVGVLVYAAPKTKHTAFVFIKEILKMRGSDASWLDGNEPPDTQVDFSDDEQELQAARRARRSKHRTELEHPGKRKMNSKDRHDSFVQKMNNKNLAESEKHNKRAPQPYEPETKRRSMPGVHMYNGVRPYRFETPPNSPSGFGHYPPMPVFPPYRYPPPPGNMSAFGGGGAGVPFNPAMPPPCPWPMHPALIPFSYPNPGCVPVRPVGPYETAYIPPPGVMYQTRPVRIPVQQNARTDLRFSYNQWNPFTNPPRQNAKRPE